VDARCSPAVVGCHLSDQAAELSANPRTAGAAAIVGQPRPVASEALLVPLHHGLRLDEDQVIDPPGPAGSQCDPEAAVSIVERWPRPPLFERGDLLTQRQILDDKVCA
jgi:hypothetical protein